MHKQTAKFNVGELVIHVRQGYRAVVVDVDPLFLASGRYHAQSAKRSFSKQRPWYRLLVDGTNLVTYVEEPMLVLDKDRSAIENPKTQEFLMMRKGHYCSNIPRH